MPTTSASTPAIADARPDGGTRSRVLTLTAALLAAIVFNTVIAVAARALGASDDFQPLTPAAYIPLTVIGFLLGTAGWTFVRAKVRRPARTLRWLVPVVLVLSFIPDVGLLTSSSQPGTGPGAVAALVLMHLAVAATALPALARAYPATTAS